MNGRDVITKWKTLKQRLSFKGLGCCGPNWSPRRTTIGTIIEEEDEEYDSNDQEEEPIIIQDQSSDHHHNQSTVVITSSSGMNLGMALATERNSRRLLDNMGPTMRKNVGPTQVKTLMRLIEETEGVDLMRKKKRRDTQKERIIVRNNKECEGENDWVCCVCMERSKGAAFIPCGHTYCRGCSRDIWINRCSCPICNRPIVQILDLF